MKAVIVAVGSEMLTPFRTDTNSLFITERLNTIGYDVRLKAVVGDDAGELARVFEDALAWADLIVIGTAVHGSLFGNSQVLGSEIERVIRNAPCPVLCVPAARVVTPLPALVTQIVPQT